MEGLMPLTRLFAVTLVMCSLHAFSQDQQPKTSQAQGKAASAVDTDKTVAATPSEPWRIVPNQPTDASTGASPQDRLRIEDYKIFQVKKDDLRGQPWNVGSLNLDIDRAVFVPFFNGQLDDDTTCYAIRSYVVARDNKDSDSTHPVSSSTCQKASRYRVKTAEAHTFEKH
jgi:hypothetical protein